MLNSQRMCNLLLDFEEVYAREESTITEAIGVQILMQIFPKKLFISKINR